MKHRRLAAVCATFAAASAAATFSACVGTSSSPGGSPSGEDAAAAVDGAVVSSADGSVSGPDASTPDATVIDAGADAPVIVSTEDAGSDARPSADASDASDANVGDAADAAPPSCVSPTALAARIYYTRPPDGDAGNALGSTWYVDGTGEHFVTPGYGPTVSPDGRYMLYHAETGTYFGANNNIWIYDMSLGTQTRVFSDNDYVVGFDFTTDTPYRIVMDYQCNIQVMNLDGTGTSVINGSDCYNDEPSVRRSDGLVVYHDYTLTPSIYTMTITGANVTGVPNTVGDTYSTVFSPDGTRVLFDQTNTANIFVGDYYTIDLDGGGITELTATVLDAGVDGAIFVEPDGGVLPQGMTFSAAWAPDGAHVIAGGVVGTKQGMFAIDVPPTGNPPMPVCGVTGAVDWVGTATNNPPPALDAGIADGGGD